MQIFGFWGRAVPEIVIFFARGDSLSQNLTVLPASSGREPLARPQTLHFSRKLCRYAKGPILEGAVAEGDWGSSAREIPPQSRYARQIPPFVAARHLPPERGKSFLKGRGKSTAGNFLIAPNTLVSGLTAWLPLRGGWRGSAREGVQPLRKEFGKKMSKSVDKIAGVWYYT